MPKPCREDQVRNPATGRCVKKDGAIGKKILASEKPKSSVKKPKTPARKPSVKKPTMRERKFKVYIATESSGSALRREYQKHLSDYEGKDIKVKLISSTPKSSETWKKYNSVVLEIIVRAEKFSKGFGSEKEEMLERVAEHEARGYLKKQRWM